MSSNQELTTAKYLAESMESDTPELDAPVLDGLPGAQETAPELQIRSTASQVTGGVKLFATYVVAAAVVCALFTWATNGAANSTKAADWLFWVAGRDQTWEEYQKEQVAKGNPRLKDKDMTWMHQLLQDGYAGNNR